MKLTEKQKNVLEVVGEVVLLVVLIVAFSMFSGCSTNWTKGEGSLCRFEVSLLEAPISGQSGAQYKRDPGPADAVAAKHLSRPYYPNRSNTTTPYPHPKDRMSEREYAKYARIDENGTIRPIGRQ